MIKASEVTSNAKLKLQSTPVNEASFAMLQTSDVVAEVRKSLGDTVIPYRWDDNVLTGFVIKGISDIKQKRSDANYAYDGSVLLSGDIRDSFALALYYYTLTRAYENDAGLSENNAALAQTNDKNYYQELTAVLYFYPETILQAGINNGIQEIIRDRPDVLLTETGLMRDPEVMKIIDDQIDLPSSFRSALINYCLYDALLIKGDEKTASLHLSLFKREISGQ